MCKFRHRFFDFWGYFMQNTINKRHGLTEFGENGFETADLLISYGDHEEGTAAVYDAGDVFIRQTPLDTFRIFDLRFPDGHKAELSAVVSMLDQFLAYSGIRSGELDMKHMLSFILVPNVEEPDVFLTGYAPCFFAQTSDVPLGEINSIRLACTEDLIYLSDMADL